MNIETISILLSSFSLGGLAAPTLVSAITIATRGSSGHNGVHQGLGNSNTDLGRSGYKNESGVDITLAGRGRSGYNEVGSDDSNMDKYSSYNSQVDAKAAARTKRSSIHNKAPAAKVIDATRDGRGGYNKQ